MAADGTTVVFISHKLDEVVSIADRVTVMRDGAVVGSRDIADTSREELARLMVGRDVELTTRRGSRRSTNAPVLVLEALHLEATARRGRLADVSLEVAPGEIVGIAGVAGNGQGPLAEAAAGLVTPDAGRVVVNGDDVTGRGPRAARAAGLAYVPDDRLGTGLAPSLTIAENLQLTRAHGVLLDRDRWTDHARGLMEEFDIRAPGPHTATARLSGGNIQKVLLARELASGPSALVVSSPTRGLDVGATQFVRELLSDRRETGCGILLISVDLDEIRALSDRILVLYDGAIVLERAGGEADVTELGLAMAGVRA
jgi:general nucleoside transport system ATP-binding protein